MACNSMSSRTSTIEWVIEPPDWILLRALVYGRFALFYGFFLFVLGAAVAFAMTVDGATSGGVIVATSVVVVGLVTVFLSTADESARGRIGRYLSPIGSQSGHVFGYWNPRILAALAFAGSVCQTLLWTTDLVSPVVFVTVPIAARLVEEIAVAVIPLAGSIDWSTETYVRRPVGSATTAEQRTFDLSTRTLDRTWSLGEVTLYWFTGEGPPLLIPIPNTDRPGDDVAGSVE